MTLKRVMSGMRPTGCLHLGHYFGVIQNWKTLQQKYDCFFMIADWHALTTKYNDTEFIKNHIEDVAKDWISCGIDPEKSTIYLQSDIPEIAQLHLLLSMVTPQNWVERDPTLKDMIKILRNNSNEDVESSMGSYGLFGYPVLQTADIILFNANLVPVGQDQLSHLELSRDIVRRFNHLYKKETFIEPIPKLTQIPLLTGLDGNKMGKSNNNDIKISDSEEITIKKVMTAITDPARIRKDIPGTTTECLGIFPLYKTLADNETIEIVKQECESAKRGCVQCKRQLAELINIHFKEIRQKRMEITSTDSKIREMLNIGRDKAREIASKKLTEVRLAMKIYI